MLCVDSCPTSTPFVGKDGHCVALCPPEYPLVGEANSCVAVCSPGTLDKAGYGIKFVGGIRVCQECAFWLLVDGVRFCLDECPRGWVSRVSGECYQSALKAGSTMWFIVGAGILVILLFVAGYLVFQHAALRQQQSKLAQIQKKKRQAQSVMRDAVFDSPQTISQFYRSGAPAQPQQASLDKISLPSADPESDGDLVSDTVGLAAPQSASP